MPQTAQLAKPQTPRAPATPPSRMDLDGAFKSLRTQVQQLLAEVGKVIVGKQEVVEKLVVGALAEGSHILFEDVPGLAKSVLAATFSKAVGCDFRRVQFTPDLLPTDIIGGHIYNRSDNKFEFRQGPIFCNFLLADEINRASPKTQSALLEAMAEKQVSVEGVTHRLPPPFMVLATQNPIEQEGTYPLPEAQLDRFAMRLSMGYPTLAEEEEIIRRRLARRKDAFDTRAVVTRDQVIGMQRLIEEIFVDPAVTSYIARIVEASRQHPSLITGSSPRGSLALVKLARAHAATQGRRFVLPDDVKLYGIPALAHRVILSTDARVRGVTTTKVIAEILDHVPPPKKLGGPA